MQYLVHKPGARLSGFVEALWVLTDAPAHSRERIVPSAQRRARCSLKARGRWHLVARLPDLPQRRRAVTVGLTQLELPGTEVGHVAQELGLSRRRFIEVFTQDVGMTPKRYSMVRRFQRAPSLASRSSPAAWSQIALECGYFDQAHLCRDWSALTGVSPGQFLALRSVSVKENHTPIPHPFRNLRKSARAIDPSSQHNVVLIDSTTRVGRRSPSRSECARGFWR